MDRGRSRPPTYTILTTIHHGTSTIPCIGQMKPVSLVLSLARCQKESVCVPLPPIKRPRGHTLAVWLQVLPVSDHLFDSYHQREYKLRWTFRSVPSFVPKNTQ